MKTKKKLDREVEIPEGIKIEIVDGMIKASGSNGNAERKIGTKRIKVEVKDGKVMIASKLKPSKKEKALINTTLSHINNMIKGVTDGFTYKLKICSSHFPMSVKVNGNELEVSNFIGEKVSRKLKIKEGVDVKVEGEFINITSQSKEKAGQVASDIESLTKRPAFDRRIFQDGIYIIEKAGVEVK